MKIEIDQSGKIEETQRDTIIAYSNGISKAVKITAKTKRRLQESFRHIGEPRSFVISTFIIGIFLLIKDQLNNIQEIVIDLEYPGKEKLITSILKKIFLEQNLKNLPEIYFKLITKQSAAHKRAIEVFRKMKKADAILSFDFIAKESFTNIKRRPALKYKL